MFLSRFRSAARFAGLVVGVGGAWAPAGAHAQSLQVITQPPPTRKVPLRPTSQKPNDVSQSDCFADDELGFGVTLTNPSGQALEVWVSAGASGADCSAQENRVTTSAVCWKIASQNQFSTTNFTLPVRVQDIVRGRGNTNDGGNPGEGKADACNPPANSATTGSQYTLYFLLLSGTADTSVKQTYALNVDLVGPPGPELASIGSGDSRLTVAWKQVTANDIFGYKFYCDSASLRAKNPEQYGTPLVSLCPEGTSDAATSAAGAGGNGGSDGGTSTDGSGGDSGSGGDGGSGGGTSTDGSAAATCSPSQYLVKGTVPKSGLECGRVNSSTAIQGVVSELPNYEEVCVGVAAVDLVGNQGTLSDVKCGTPQQVYSFFQAYRSAGGGGGGGFCSLLGSTRWRYGTWYLLPFALAFLGRRVRRSFRP